MKWTDDDVQQEALSIACPICGVKAYRRCTTTGRFKNAPTTNGVHKTRLSCGRKQLHKTAREAAKETEAKIIKVDLLNGSPHQFCETLRLAASIGVTDAMMGTETRSDHDLAALLCEHGKYRYEHVRMLHEAYESGQMFMALRGQPTDMTWGTTTDTGWQETEHGRVRVRLTKGARP